MGKVERRAWMPREAQGTSLLKAKRLWRSQNDRTSQLLRCPHLRIRPMFVRKDDEQSGKDTLCLSDGQIVSNTIQACHCTQTRAHRCPPVSQGQRLSSKGTAVWSDQVIKDAIYYACSNQIVWCMDRKWEFIGWPPYCRVCNM